MKHLCQFLLAAFLFQFCSQDEAFAPLTQTVQFTFALPADTPTDLPEGSAVVLTITTPSAELILKDHQVRIHPFDNGFISEPISLPSSQYLITDFMVVHDDLALYVTPKSGSKFSGDVSSTLSYTLSLQDNTVVPLQVVGTANAAAEDFGYTRLRVSNFPEWKIMVFTREDGALKATAAWAHLRVPGLSYGWILEPKINTLQFQGEPERTYTLIVEKAGYVTHTSDFVYDDIRGNGKKPVRIILNRLTNDNSFTITPPGAAGGFTFNLGLRGTGSLTINWGDGTVETMSFAPDAGGDVSLVAPTHDYASPPDGIKISITGALDQIFEYEGISVYVTDVDPRNLTGLERFYVEGASINGLLDLSSNAKLQSIRLMGTYVWELRLPESHEISEVLLTAELSDPIIDMLINNIHRNAIEKNISSGTVTILPPLEFSAESAAKVQELVDDYGWQLLELE